MRVPDTIKKCVVFIGRVRVDQGNLAELQPRGTAFIVAQPSEFGDRDIARFSYLVTAKHVIDGLEGELCGARMNRRDGGTELVNLGNKWWFHPTDPDVDVAIIPFGGHSADVTTFDFAVFDTESFATDEAIAEAQIGVGDEVFLTGLFAHNLGSSQNMPIVRMGNIALLAGEPIQHGKRKMQAHLIESRSIGGLSGSPAFVRQTISIGFAHPREFDEHELYHKMKPGELPSPEFPVFITGVGPFFLLGLMHGHWDIPVGQKNKVLVTEDESGKVNMGIALVVPATKILETINQPELAEMRREIHEAQQKGLAEPTLDNLGEGLTGEKAREEVTQTGARIAVPTRDSFLRDLAKATRRLKSSE